MGGGVIYRDAGILREREPIYPVPRLPGFHDDAGHHHVGRVVRELQIIIVPGLRHGVAGQAEMTRLFAGLANHMMRRNREILNRTIEASGNDIGEIFGKGACAYLLDVYNRQRVAGRRYDEVADAEGRNRPVVYGGEHGRVGKKAGAGGILL